MRIDQPSDDVRTSCELTGGEQELKLLPSKRPREVALAISPAALQNAQGRFASLTSDAGALLVLF